MKLYDTMSELLADARTRDREIRFIDGEKDESVLTFAELWDAAVSLLGTLQQRGMTAGDELIVFTRSNRDFVIAFWAAILGGIVPVPVAVGISDEHRFKLFRILTQLERATLLTDSDLLSRLQEFANTRQLNDVSTLLASRSTVFGAQTESAAGELHTAAADDLAFIQYSSGSTSDPKGVCLTHKNLCTNIRAIVEAGGWNEDDQSLSWMPLTHDMGLIGYHLSVLAAGMNHAVMDTNLFVRRPLLWMSKANELRATQLCSPNFGYKHFLKLFTRKGLPDLDLSCVKSILNGAEPISWELCEDFLAALAPHGLRRTAMVPVYGLAEATVGVSFPEVGQEYSRIIVHRHSLSVGESFEYADAADADAVSFVKVGVPIRDVSIRICDDNDAELPEEHIGHIQLQGDSVTARVYGDEQATAALFTDDNWLRTGDCGTFVDGQLLITGRQKDLIIVNGQNYYPHDLEEIAAGLDELDLNKVVVAGATPGGKQTEQLLAFVLYRQDVEAFKPLADKVRTIIGEHAGLEVDHVIPVSRIPKTTSGKVQRAALLNEYLNGEFDSLLAELAPPTAESIETDDDPLVAELERITHEFAKERKISADENLFESGLTSLTLTEIVLAIDERYPGKVDISDLFDYPSLRDVARLIRSKENA